MELILSGAWSSKGQLEFLTGDDPRTHRIEFSDVVLPHTSDRDSVSLIEVDTVDNLLGTAAPAHIDYAEITVNGVELEVLKGMEVTLPKVRRIFVAGMMRHSDGTALNNEVANFLTDQGFVTTITSEGNKIDGWGAIDLSLIHI